MVTGWRRAFCTSIPKDRETSALPDKQQCNCNCNSGTHSPRIRTKFGFLSSNPSTPRVPSQQPISSPSLRCKITTTATTTTTTSSLPSSPKLQCKTPPPKKSVNSPRFFHFSNNNNNNNSSPSSPKSPSSTFSLLKSTLCLSKSRCGICIQSVKSGQGTAIFTAECNHMFHFPCVTAHLKKHPSLLCPVCSAKWKQLPLLSIHHCATADATKNDTNNNNISLKDIVKSTTNKLRVYNDDEPLMSPFSIPELEENDIAEEDNDQEFQGFFVNTPPVNKKVYADVAVSLLAESAVVAVGRGFETRVVVMKARAPPCVAASGVARGAAIDLVMVLDVSERMSGVRSQVMKRAMRLVVSSLSSADRLSMVAFSGNSKRLFPLRRMTADGRRSVRRLVDALLTGSGSGQGMISVKDALKKAAKVIEDRREKNPVATIMIVSSGHDGRSDRSSNHNHSPLVVSSTRFSHLEIPVHSFGFGEVSAYNHAPFEDAFAKSIRRLLSVVVQDLNLQLGFTSGSAEISAVYSLTNRPGVFGSGLVRIGDLHAGEEWEFLLELKVPISSVGSHHISVQSSFKDASSQELILSKEKAMLLPKSQAARSSLPNIQRLRNLHTTTRAVVESRRLVDLGDLAGAHHLLSSARTLLMQSSNDTSASEYLLGLEAELAELYRRRQVNAGQGHRQRNNGNHQQVEEKPEPLTPTSAWRAAERLAKVAIMRKHMNRVSDLHGFENARF